MDMEIHTLLMTDENGRGILLASEKQPERDTGAACKSINV
jgi:hypothetical protein